MASNTFNFTNSKPGGIVLIDGKSVRRIISVTKTGITILVRPEQMLDGETETIPFKTKRKIEIITMAQAAKILTS